MATNPFLMTFIFFKVLRTFNLVDRFIEQFSKSWLELNKLGVMQPDEDQCREYYDYNLEDAGQKETHHFMRHMIEENQPIEQFLDSKYTFVNRGLAEFYGLEKPERFDRVNFQKVRQVLDFEPAYTVRDGVVELLQAIENHVFDEVDQQRNLYGNYEINYP